MKEVIRRIFTSSSNRIWISKTNLGLKRIILLCLLFTLLCLFCYFFAWSHFFALSLLIFFIFICIVLFFAIRNGIFVHVADSGASFEVIDHFVFLKPEKSMRLLVSKKDISRIESKMYLFLSKTWAYGDPIRIILSSFKIKNALILGGGGGSVPYLLTPYKAIKDIVVVDLSAKMITVSQRYFSTIPNQDDVEKVRLICADAEKFVSNEKSKYDFVFIDLFSEVGLVDFVFDKNFILRIKKITHKNSVIIINFSNYYKKLPQCVAVYQSVFSDFQLYQEYNSYIGVITPKKITYSFGRRLI